ncbi:hypothetical protein QE370_003445 [Aeromicrobium sp. SORGH_AS981]|jgi:hypothetical protein|uniref:hypothetical protein n=1 Tax=Aeromicrobium sp. SORGH_AS_0981 TaxID=3041802 RepID=UPI002861DF59|nr:hypothetical protein [Aeromicrobium sp. SORGH_AS_0981]MDR6120261.1 hypothetical protein [Aeromicrobium sp. SORGH_AS_0981]
MAQAIALYNLGLTIYRALQVIATPGSSNAQIAAAIATINTTTTAYQNTLSNMWNFLQPYFPHYNQRYVTAFQDWVGNGVTRIDTALAPVIMDGNAHGGVYSQAVLAAQAPDLMVCMGDLNAFRNPYNAQQLEVPYYNAPGQALQLPEREEILPGDFDPDTIGLPTDTE